MSNFMSDAIKNYYEQLNAKALCDVAQLPYNVAASGWTSIFEGIDIKEYTQETAYIDRTEEGGLVITPDFDLPAYKEMCIVVAGILATQQIHITEYMLASIPDFYLHDDETVESILEILNKRYSLFLTLSKQRTFMNYLFSSGMIILKESLISAYHDMEKNSYQQLLLGTIDEQALYFDISFKALIDVREKQNGTD